MNRDAPITTCDEAIKFLEELGLQAIEEFSYYELRDLTRLGEAIDLVRGLHERR